MARKFLENAARSFVIGCISGIASPIPTSLFPSITSPLITPTGPIVGPGYDIGPTVGHVISPVSPAYLYNPRPLVTTKGSKIGTTSNSVVVSSSPFGSVFQMAEGVIGNNLLTRVGTDLLASSIWLNAETKHKWFN